MLLDNLLALLTH